MDPNQTNQPDPPADQPAAAPDLVTPGAGQVFTPGGTTMPAEAPAPAATPVPGPEPAASTAPPVVDFHPEAIYGAVQTFSTQNSAAGTPAATAPAAPKRGKKKFLLAGVLGVLILLGGSAAAYFGYYMPNKPENILASALQNSLLKHQFTTQGSLQSSSSGLSAKAEYTVKADADKHATDTTLKVTVSGVAIDAEVITSGGNAYVKVGDLSAVEDLANGLLGDSQDIKSFEDQMNKQIANQWVEIDSTLINEAKLSCLTNYRAALNQSDIKALQAGYKSDSFATVLSHSSDTVNGAAAIKYDLQIDDNKLADFKPSGSDYFSKLEGCLKNISQLDSTDTASLKDNDKTPLTLWVDKKSKLIVKYASQSTAQDKQKDNLELAMSGTISYNSVNISAPADSKPLMSLLSNLDLSGMFGSSGTNDLGVISGTGSADTERKTDINAMQGFIEAYFADNGHYPTLANINDPAWRAQNMQGLDDGAFKDPAGSSDKLAAAPAAHVYAYQVTPVGCDNGAKGDCTEYSLTATLDNGTTYVKQSNN